MEKEDKRAFVEQMKAEMARAPAVVLADYRGLTVAQMNALRSRCREAGVKFKVVKNTLMKRAVAGSELEAAADLLEGPTAAAWHEDDPGAAARVLLDFLKDKANENLKIKGAGVKGRKLSAEEVKTKLAALPTRSQFLAQLAGMMASGPQRLHAVLSAAPAKMVFALYALKQQREQGGQGAAASGG